MAIYTVKSGDTLSKIGQQFGVNFNQITGYRSGNPNLIYPGEVLNIPSSVPAPAINANPTIPGLLAQVPATPVTPVAPALTTPTPVTPQSPQSPQSLKSLNISTGNPALKTLFDSANQLLNTYTSQGGTLTPEIQQRIQAINDAELQKQGAVAGARTAADNKNAPVLDSNLQTANTATTTQQKELQSLLDELKTARQNYITTLTPTEAETDLQTKLNTLRTERQLLPLELRQEGISAPGIQGRQVEDERVRAIQEQNLLLELGLKQDARNMSMTAGEKQVSFITDDIALQQKIQENLTAQENKVLEQARNLRVDSLNALSNIADSFKGLAWTDLDPQTQSDVSNLLKNYPDLTPQIVADAMKTAKQQQVFDNSIRQANALTATKTKQKALTATETKQADVSSMAGQLQTRLGQDGFINPSDWATAKRAWVAAGYTSNEFDNSFGVYKNPNDPVGYL